MCFNKFGSAAAVIKEEVRSAVRGPPAEVGCGRRIRSLND
ncbi:hypothetical protein SAMN05518670_4510 [Paenibacillus sp. OK076]|nr:hypothetical protein SAMN05518670_4510 [Paenibacillus sp. OK076]